MASKRYFMVNNGRDVVASGSVTGGPTTVNNLAINAGAAIAELFDLDVVASVSAGKTEEATGLYPQLKDKVKDGETRYKAVTR